MATLFEVPKGQASDKLALESTKIENLITESSDSDGSKKGPSSSLQKIAPVLLRRSVSPNLPELVEVSEISVNQVSISLFCSRKFYYLKHRWIKRYVKLFVLRLFRFWVLYHLKVNHCTIYWYWLCRGVWIRKRKRKCQDHYWKFGLNSSLNLYRKS